MAVYRISDSEVVEPRVRSNGKAKSKTKTKPMKNPYESLGKKEGGGKRALVFIACALVLLGGMGFGVYKLATRPPKPTGDPVKVAKYVASDAFKDLAPEKQQEYADAMRNNRDALRDNPKITDDVVRAAMSNVRDQRQQQGQIEFAKKLATEYFSLKTTAEKNAYLDQMIDEGEKRRAEFQARAATRPSTRRTNPDGSPRGNPADGSGTALANAGGPGGPGGQGGPGGPGGPGGRGARRDNPDTMRQRIETMPAEQRAIMGQFRADMAARRQQRGLPATGGGPGGGGGGGGRGRGG